MSRPGRKDQSHREFVPSRLFHIVYLVPSDCFMMNFFLSRLFHIVYFVSFLLFHAIFCAPPRLFHIVNFSTFPYFIHLKGSGYGSRE